MFWIALSPCHEDERVAWAWHALAFTSCVACAEEAVLLEISASQRLFGGPARLLRALLAAPAPLQAVVWAQADTALVALALLRLRLQRRPTPTQLPGDLPVDVLSAAAPHVEVLLRAGLRTWGALHALPRAGVARRFGSELLDALDAAWGLRPEIYAWLQRPEVFDQRIELPQPATTAPELLWAAQRLLRLLQVWLRAGQLGVLALELQWTLDLKRLDGVSLPPHQALLVRTAQPVQEIEHLRRLLAERLERTPIAAPASHLRLRSLQTVPWQASSRSFLPEDNAPGERLHQLVERLSARLGEHNVRVPLPQADWRPERSQRWVPALHNLAQLTGPQAPPGAQTEPPPASWCGFDGQLLPTWLLPQPLRLPMQGHRPCYRGQPLQMISRRQRVETGWWEAGGAVVRDYRIARTPAAGLLWVYCEHVPQAQPQTHGQSRSHGQPPQSRWFLQGLYA